MKGSLAIALFVGLAGCASAPLPPEAAAVKLSRVPSKSVAIYQPKFVVQDGQLVLDGWVYRQFGASTTARTHLDIAFLDKTGRELHSEVTNFTPGALLGGGHRMQPRGHYAVPIPGMPRGTAKIEVRAHDDPHDPPATSRRQVSTPNQP